MVIRPEHRIILACAQASSGSEWKEHILHCIDEPIDWEYLVQTAATHGMTSQLFWYLDKSCREAVPKEIFERLRNRFHKSSRSSLFFTAELIKIVQLFNQNNIPVIPFKGPSLALMYEDSGLREFCDLDALVKEQDAFRSAKLLREMNYCEVPGYAAALQSRILSQRNHYRIRKENSPVVVELHWAILPAYFTLPIQIEAWWRRAKHASLEGHRILTLSPEDLLIALCIHACKHVWRSLDLFADIAMLLNRHRDFNWDRMLSDYTHPDVRRILFVSLIAANGLVNAAVPQEILRMAGKDSKAVRFAREVQSGIFLHEGPEAFRFVTLQLGMKSCWADRFRFAYRIVCAPVFCKDNVVLPRFMAPFHR
jgi:hypothetical protein